ncbi:partitioning protein, partial [human gut metagenome]
FGKTEAYIRTRLKFVSLIPEIALLLEQDEITISVASEICRYGEEIQREVYDQHLKEGVQYNSWRGMKASEVAQSIERQYTADLNRYSFDKTL